MSGSDKGGRVFRGIAQIPTCRDITKDVRSHQRRKGSRRESASPQPSACVINQPKMSGRDKGGGVKGKHKSPRPARDITRICQDAVKVVGLKERASFRSYLELLSVPCLDRD